MLMLRQRTVRLSPAKVRALPTTDAVIIPAQGRYRRVVPIMTALHKSPGAYGNVDGAAWGQVLSVDRDNGDNVSARFSWSGWLDTAERQSFFLDGDYHLSDGVISQTNPDYNDQGFNAPLVLVANNEGDFTGAGGVVIVALLYLLFDRSRRCFI